MNQVFSCRRCGTQNSVGQLYCRSCGERFEYICSCCNGTISLPSRFCANCGAKLNQPGPPNAEMAPIKSVNYPDVRGINQYSISGKQPKANSSSILGFIGLIIGIAVIVSGLIFVNNSDLLKISSAPPPSISPQVDTTPAQITTPESEAAGMDSTYYNVPDYVKQYSIKQALFNRASGESVNLVNNPNAKDVSFDELKAFILKDNTDEEKYIEGVRMCVDFAESLHNNAEQAGIKAAVVGIRFQGEEVGHAINAFVTTDKGLVYIDCTGEGTEPVTVNEWVDKPTYTVEHDKIAYIDKGEKYGVISIDRAMSLKYDFYTGYVQDWQKCIDMVKAYNQEVQEYNSEVEGKTFYEGSPELARVQAWKAELIEKEAQIRALAEKLGNYMFEPLGIVDTVSLYW